MKKLILLLSFFYFHSFGQNRKPDLKQIDPCQVITLEIIKQDNVKVYSTNVLSVKPKYKLYYEKFVGPKPKRIITYYLNLRMATLTSMPKSKGVVIFLKNGKKLVKPQEDVFTESRGDDFERSALVSLSGTDLLLLKQSPITEFKLYNAIVHVDQSELYFELFNCLLKKE